jgi:hypothetical protein
MATEYNMADYESDEGEEFLDPPQEQNLFSAALFLQELLASHDIPHALTGGFSLRLRGRDRQARQIDFAVQPSGGMRQLKEMLRPYPRSAYPEEQNRGLVQSWILTSGRRIRYPNMCEGIMKIFVETGPGFDDCAAYRRIEVDLKGPGKMSTILASCNDLADLNCQGIAGSPLDLEKCRIEITADVGNGRAEKITLLDLIHALNGKLKVLYERRYERDFQDVHWFLAEYPEQIRKHADELDEDGLRTFIDSLPNEKSAFWNNFFDLSDLESEHGSDHVEGSSR